MCYIKGSNIIETHKSILEHVLHPERFEGEEQQIEIHEVWDEEGNMTKEVHNILVSIKNPLEEGYMVCPTITQDELDIYAECYTDVDCAREKGFLPGQRLFDFLGVNQYESTVNLLKVSPESRRGSIITCNPQMDWLDDRPPSLLLVDLKLREKKLVMTGVLRSNDMYRTWPANAYALAKLQKKLSEDINVEPGHLDILSISAHIYEEDFDKAERAYI